MSTAQMSIDITSTSRPPFARLVGVELRKTWDTRAGVWLLAAIVAITGLFMGIFFAVSDADERTFSNFIGIAATPQSLLLPVLGILLVTSEWSQRSAMVTFALEPSRTRVIGAKLVAALLLGFAAFVAAMLLAAVCTLVGGGDGGFEGVDAADFGTFFLLQEFTIIQGLAYGLIFLNTPAAIVTFFVLPTASSIVFSLVSWLNDIRAWVDLATAQSPLFSGEIDLTGEEWAQLGTTTLIWIILPFVAGWIRVMRAEVK